MREQLGGAVKELVQGHGLSEAATPSQVQPPLPDGPRLQRMAPPSRDAELVQAYAELSKAASQAGASQARIFRKGAQNTLAVLGSALERTVQGQKLPEGDKQKLIDLANQQTGAWDTLGSKYGRSSGPGG